MQNATVLPIELLIPQDTDLRHTPLIHKHYYVTGKTILCLQPVGRKHIAPKTTGPRLDLRLCLLLSGDKLDYGSRVSVALQSPERIDTSSFTHHSAFPFDFIKRLPWATCRDRPLILQLFYPGITAEGIIGITRSVACCHAYVLRWDNGVYSPSTYYPDDCLYAMQLYGKHYTVLFPSFSLEFSISIAAYTTVHFYKYPCSCAEMAMHPCTLIKRSFTWLCLMRHSGIEPEQFFIRICGVWCTFIDLLEIYFTDF